MTTKSYLMKRFTSLTTLVSQSQLQICKSRNYMTLDKALTRVMKVINKRASKMSIIFLIASSRC